MQVMSVIIMSDNVYLRESDQPREPRATHINGARGARSLGPGLTGDARLEFLRNSGPAPEMKMERAGQ